MKEFIVWDKEDKEWLKNEDMPICACDGRRELILNADWASFHQYIGKTDINNKKIYAGCSIVELNDGMSTMGYFTYCDKRLKYVIKVVGDSIVEEVSTDNWDFFNFKIIDTIQENKLGLIK